MKTIWVFLGLLFLGQAEMLAQTVDVEREATAATVQLVFRRLDYSGKDFETYDRLLKTSGSPNTYGNEIAMVTGPPGAHESVVTKTAKWLRAAVSLFPLENEAAHLESFGIEVYSSMSTEPIVNVPMLTAAAIELIGANPTDLSPDTYYQKVPVADIKAISPSALNGLLDGFAACGAANLQANGLAEAACRTALALALEWKIDSLPNKDVDLSAIQKAALALFSTDFGSLTARNLRALGVKDTGSGLAGPTNWPNWLPVGRVEDGKLIEKLTRLNVSKVATAAQPQAENWQPRDVLSELYTIMEAAVRQRLTFPAENSGATDQMPLSYYLVRTLVAQSGSDASPKELVDQARRLFLEEHLRRLEKNLAVISPDRLAGLFTAETGLLQSRNEVLGVVLTTEKDPTVSTYWTPACQEVPRFKGVGGATRAADLAFIQTLLNYMSEDLRKQNTPEYRALAEIALTELCQSCRTPDQLEVATEQGLSRACSKLLGFWRAAREAQEEAFALRFLKWTPHFWRNEMWQDKDAWISGATENKFNAAKAYHGLQVKLLAHFSARLANSWAQAASYSQLVKPTKSDKESLETTYQSHEAYQIAQALQSEAAKDRGTRLYQQLFGFIYGQVPILVGQRSTSDIAPSPTPASTTLAPPFSKLDGFEVMSLTHFVAPQQKFGTLTDPDFLEVFSSLTLVLPPDLKTVAQKFCHDIDATYSTTTANPSAVVAASGVGIYEESLFHVFAIAYLRQLEDKARLAHMRVGFIQTVDPTTGQNRPTAGQKLKLAEAQKLSERSRALLEAMLEAGPISQWEAAATSAAPNDPNRGVAGLPTSPFGLEDFFSLHSPLWTGIKPDTLKLPQALLDSLTATGAIRLRPSNDGSVVPLIALTRMAPIQLLPPDPALSGNAQGEAGLPPILSLADQALARLWITNREQSNAIKAGRDAFGIAGPLQASNGTQDLLTTMAMLANWLQRNDLDSLKTWVTQELNKQEANIAAVAADSDVMAEAAMLGALEKDQLIAQKMIEYSKLGAEALRSDAIAHHFLQESFRLQADAAQARAAEKLLQWNRDAYEEFQLKVQYEMILAALPTYYLELKKSKLELAAIDDIARDLSALIAEKREAFLKNDGKSIGDIVRAVAVKLVDCVCAFYGLPPLGSLINTAFEGLQAGSHGDWNAAFQNFADVAQKSGVTDWMQDNLKDWGEELGIGGLIADVKQSPQFQNFSRLAEQSGLKDAAESYSLCLVNRAAKSILPVKAGDAVDLLLPTSKLSAFQGEELAKRLVATVSEEGRRLGESYLRSSGQAILLSLSEKTQYEAFVKKQLGDKTEGKIEIGAALESAESQALADVKTTIDAAVEKRGEAFKARMLARTVALALADAKQTPPDKISELIGHVESEIRSTPSFSLSAWWSAEKPSAARAELGVYLAMIGKDQEVRAMEEGLKKGQIGAVFSGPNLKNLGQSLIASASGEVTGKVDRNAPDPQKVKESLAEAENWIRETLVQVETTVQMNVAHETCKEFYPKVTGVLIKALADWEDELNQRLDALLNKSLAATLKTDYDNLTAPYRQVDLRKFFKDEDIKRFLSPPKVTLDSKFEAKFKEFDQDLTQAEQVVRQSFDAGTSQQFHKLVDDITRYKDPGAFEAAKKDLLAVLLKPKNEAEPLIDAAIVEAGTPPQSVATKELDDAIADLAKTETKRLIERTRLNKLSDAEAEPLLPSDLRIEQIALKRKAVQVAFVKMLGSDEKGDNLQAAKVRPPVGDKTRKLAGFDDLEKPEAAEIKTITDYEVLFVLGKVKAPDGHPPLLQGEQTDEVKSAIQERVSLTIERMQTLLHSTNNSWTGLFGTAAELYDQQYGQFVKQLQSLAEQDSAQNSALAFAHGASAEAAYKRATDLRAKQGDIGVKMAEITLERAGKAVEAQRARQAAAEARFQVAVTKRDQAAFQQWESHVSGADYSFAPTDYAEIQTFLWRCIRDYDFFVRVLEANPEQAESFFRKIVELIDPQTGLLQPKAMNAILDQEELKNLIVRNNSESGGWSPRYLSITLKRSNWDIVKPYLKEVSFPNTVFGKYVALPINITPFRLPESIPRPRISQSLFAQLGEFQLATDPLPANPMNTAWTVETWEQLDAAQAQVITDVAYDSTLELPGRAEHPALAFLGDGRFYTKVNGEISCNDFEVANRHPDPSKYKGNPFVNPQNGGLGYYYVQALSSVSNADPLKRLQQTVASDSRVNLPVSRRFRFYPLMGTWEILLPKEAAEALSQTVKRPEDDLGITLYLYYSSYTQ